MLDPVQAIAQVRMNGAGDAVAAWLELDGTSSDYFVRAAVRSGGSWSSAQDIASSPATTRICCARGA